MAVIVAACGSGKSNPGPPPDVEDPEVEPPGVTVEIAETDLPSGASVTDFYHDVPGLLSELDDPLLSVLAEEARAAGGVSGQGFLRPETGEFLFVITFALETATRANAGVDYIGSLSVQRVFDFISPGELLFDQERSASPGVGDASLRYFLRYGVEESGVRTRDVGTDLIIFAKGGSLVFMLRSVNLRSDPIAEEDAIDLVELGKLIADRIGEELARQAVLTR